MCQYVDNLFDGIDETDLNDTESYWVSKLGSAYNRYPQSCAEPC